MISKLVRWMSLGVCHIKTTIPSGFTTLLPLLSSIREVHDVIKGDEAQLNGASGSDRKKTKTAGGTATGFFWFATWRPSMDGLDGP